jgi:hypothetical protein
MPDKRRLLSRRTLRPGRKLRSNRAPRQALIFFGLAVLVPSLSSGMALAREAVVQVELPRVVAVELVAVFHQCCAVLVHSAMNERCCHREGEELV